LSLQLWRSYWASWASFMLGCPPPRNTTDKRLGKKPPRKSIRMPRHDEMPRSAIRLIGPQFVPQRVRARGVAAAQHREYRWYRPQLKYRPPLVLVAPAPSR